MNRKVTHHIAICSQNSSTTQVMLSSEESNVVHPVQHKK